MTGREYSDWGASLLFCRGLPLQGVFCFRRLSLQLRSNRPIFRWRRDRPKASARPVLPLEPLLRLPLPLLPSPLPPRLPLDCLPPEARDQRPDRPQNLEPDGTTALRAIGDLANASSQPRTADEPRPRVDGPSPGAQDTINEADQLRTITEALRAELDVARQRLHDLELPRCFKCGSLQHRLEVSKALADAATRWVQLAEPSQ